MTISYTIYDLCKVTYYRSLLIHLIVMPSGLNCQYIEKLEQFARRPY